MLNNPQQITLRSLTQKDMTGRLEALSIQFLGFDFALCQKRNDAAMYAEALLLRAPALDLQAAHAVPQPFMPEVTYATSPLAMLNC